MRRGTTLVGGAIVLIVLIGLAGVFSDRIGSSDGSDYDYYDDYYEDWYQVTTSVEQVIDPWTPEDGGEEAAKGNRFVAVEVTIENDPGSEYPYYLEDTDFKLTDTEGFAYGTARDGEHPTLPFVNLDPGEKARGWVTFEVREGAEIASMSDYFSTFDLPD